jgi:protein-tyrosine phosphatase
LLLKQKMPVEIPIPTSGKLFSHRIPIRVPGNFWADNQITCIVDLMGCPRDQRWAEDVEHIQFVIRDYSIPEDSEATRTLIHHVCEKLMAGTNVAIHCMGGAGRTGMIVSLVYARLHGVSGAEALRACRRLNPSYVETPEQEAFVARMAPP